MNAILSISIPVLNAIYPVAIVLIALSFIHRGEGAGRKMYPAAILLTGIVSVIYSLEQTRIVIPVITGAVSLLPGYGLGLGWLIPAAIGIGIGRMLPEHSR